MSYFRTNIDKLKGYVPGFQPAGDDIVKLNTNENPYAASPHVKDAIKKVTVDSLRKYPEPVSDTFRHAASEVLGIEPENILCTNGGDDLLTIVIRAFCDDKHPVSYPGPTYSLYPVLADIQDCPPCIELPFGEDGSLPEELADMPAGLTIVCNPNAPTATLLAPEKLKELADKLKGKSILLIDEAYVDFAPSNCLNLIETCENVIILRSMSKGYSLAGIRFGFGIACKELIAGLMKVKDSYNVDALANAAATAAIKDQEHFRKNVEKVQEERARLTERLRDIGFVVGDSHANFVFAQSTTTPAGDIYEALADRGIYVRYFNLPGLEDKLRITVGKRKQNDRLLDVLEELDV
jgi:histidinol-phosphate aminotransferase